MKILVLIFVLVTKIAPYQTKTFGDCWNRITWAGLFPLSPTNTYQYTEHPFMVMMRTTTNFD